MNTPVPPLPFSDRYEAGRVLAAGLSEYQGRPRTLVLALPRGGVPVAFEIAQFLRAPLDVFNVRKLGVPGQEELAFGAIASGGIRVVNRGLVAEQMIGPEVIEAVVAREQEELDRRERLYRGARPAPPVRDGIVLLIDDGMATGSTMLAGVRALRERGPAELIVAVPVAAARTCKALRPEADRVICAVTPEHFNAVGQWYRDFSETTDEEVRELLKRASQRAF